MHRPTDEQALALEYFRKGQPLKITAFAGAGKTTILELLARSRMRAVPTYLSTKRLLLRRQGDFLRVWTARTTHSIAWRAVSPHIGSQPV